MTQHNSYESNQSSRPYTQEGYRHLDTRTQNKESHIVRKTLVATALAATALGVAKTGIDAHDARSEQLVTKVIQERANEQSDIQVEKSDASIQVYVDEGATFTDLVGNNVKIVTIGDFSEGEAVFLATQYVTEKFKENNPEYSDGLLQAGIWITLPESITITKLSDEPKTIEAAAHVKSASSIDIS